MEVILEESERSPEGRERADAEADKPRGVGGGPLFFLGEVNTDLIGEVIEGTLGMEWGGVYAEAGKDGRGQNCVSNSSTSFLNIELDPVIVMVNEDWVG